MIIKIYTPQNISITTLFNIDFDSLSYIKELGDIGSMSFQVRTDNNKITKESIKCFNRISFEENGFVKFTGFISHTQINLETVQIRCYGLLGLLKAKIAPNNANFSGSVNAVVQNIINLANLNEDTLIRGGDLSATENITRSINGDTLFDILVDVTSGTSNQFIFDDNTKKISVRKTVGNDLSNSFVLNYDTRIINLSNLLNFNISDSGTSVISVLNGKTTSLNSYKEDSFLIAKYGRVERIKNYNAINDINTLNLQVESDLSDSEYVPDFTLKPDIQDSFEVGDILGVKLYNKLIDIDTRYQVLEKEVVYNGTEKLIKIKVNKKQTNILDIIKKHEKDITSINNHL